MMIILLFSLLPSPLWAQSTSIEKMPDAALSAPADSKTTTLETIRILDNRERLDQVSASQTVGSQVLQNQKIQDVNRALKQVPGVQIQEEDGMGLRPNIGLRGTHPHRSRKVVLLEDGVLIGPAPYAAPAAYYSPSMLHTGNLEVMKGLAAVPYGPNSIGGAINYRTRPIPLQNQTRAQVSGGSFGQQIYLLEGGGKSNGLAGLLNVSKAESNGFKKLPDDKSTGFSKNDLLMKSEYELPGASHQAKVGFKLGYADEISDETYTGLTANDFAQDPFRRYASSAQDEMRWKHTRLQFDYQQLLGQGTIKATAYRHDFHRNWNRLNGFRNQAMSIDQVMRNPTGRQLPYYQVLTGEEDSSSIGTGGDLAVIQNDRFFYSQGVQTELWQSFTQGEKEHRLSVSFRLHQDQIERHHRTDYFSMTQGQLERVTPTSLLTAQNRDSASARTLGVGYEMDIRRWRFQFMGRAESVEYAMNNDLSGESESKSVEGFAPGAGLAYKVTDNWTVGSTVARGLTLVGVNAVDDEDPEQSINYEVFSRYLNEDLEVQAELAGFFNDYQNIKGTASFASGSTNDQLNEEYSGGKAKVYGLEGRLAKRFRYGSLGLPIRANMTWLSAQFAENSESKNPEWGTGQIQSGDPLPYIPAFQGTLAFGTEFRKWQQELLFQYTSAVYDQSVSQGRLQLPAYGIIDWNTRYQYTRQGHLFARVDNLLGKEYAVSWRPFGLRPGKPQSVMVGIEQVF